MKNFPISKRYSSTIRKLLFIGLLSFTPLNLFALPVSPENLKNLEQGFILPCDQIGNENCISRLIGVNACTFIFGINKGKNYKDAMRIADNVFIAVMKGNNLDVNDMFEKDGFIKKQIRVESKARINMCREQTKKAIPVLFKESLGGDNLPEERIEGASLAFAEYWLDNFEMMRRGKK